MIGRHWQWQTRNQNQSQLTLTNWDKLGHVIMMHWPGPRAGQQLKKVCSDLIQLIHYFQENDEKVNKMFEIHSTLLIELHQNRIFEHAWLCQPDLMGGLGRKNVSLLWWNKSLVWQFVLFHDVCSSPFIASLHKLNWHLILVSCDSLRPWHHLKKSASPMAGKWATPCSLLFTFEF